MGSSGELAEVSVTHASWNGSGSGQQPSPAPKLATIREIITRHVHYNTLLRQKDNVGSAFVVCEFRVAGPSSQIVWRRKILPGPLFGAFACGFAFCVGGCRGNLLVRLLQPPHHDSLAGTVTHFGGTTCVFKSVRGV